MESKKNLYQRINAIMKEVSYIKKGARVGYGNNSYSAVTHDDVTALLHSVFVDHGVMVIPSMESHEQEMGKTAKGGLIYISNAWVSVEFVNIDDATERFTSKAFAIGFDSQDKGPGKAYSMAVKYAYLKTFMIESGDKEEDRKYVNNGDDKYIEAEIVKARPQGQGGASEKQRNYLKMLLDEKYGEGDIPKDVLTAIPGLTASGASNKIAGLKKELGHDDR